MPLFVAVIVVVVGLDQASKLWIVRHFALHESREIIAGFFNLTYLTNNGAAFSILAGQPALWRQAFFIGAASVALVLICIGQRSYGRTNHWYNLALALIAGGAIGNLIDRVRLGHVIDFLDVYVGTYHWPAFNVADAAITVGVLLFLLSHLVFDRQ
jgi:signal peptidase II